MSKIIEKLLDIENEQEFLEALKDPETKREWDKFKIEDQKETEKFIKLCQSK